MVFTSYVDDCICTIKKMAAEHKIALKKGIEFFCGDGALYTKKLAGIVGTLVGVDVREEAGKKLIEECNNVSFVCQDSILYATFDYDHTYDIISIDNPLCIYGNNYCEHFEILDHVQGFVNDDKKSILSFDFVTTPYNEHSLSNAPWLFRRMQYYNLDSYIIDSNYAKRFYQTKLNSIGIDVIDMESVCREKCDNNCYFHMMVCAVQKRK